MLKADKAWVWQTPQTLFWEHCFVAAAVCDGFQENGFYQESRCLSRFKQEWAEHWTIVAMQEEYKHLYHLC